MFKILFFAFLLYLLYRLVFHFILPIYRTTRQVKKSFREMNERMHRQNQGFQQQSTPSPAPGKENKAGEYIDFEEMKD